MYKIIHPWFYLNIFVNFMEKEPSTNFYHFSQTGEVTKFSMIQLCLNVCDVIQANKHTYFAAYGLYVNFWNFRLIAFCFMMRKDNFKQNLLLWPQIPLRI